MELLLARCPESKLVRETAENMGVSASRYPAPAPRGFGAKDEALVDCILCGLCVRACTEAIGASAIGFAERGPSRRVATPFLANSAACIGCGACAAVCPTGVIKIEDTPEGIRRIPFLHTEVPLRKCASCGSFFAPAPQLDGLRGKAVSVQERMDMCPACRMRGFAAEMTARQVAGRQAVGE
jgi:ferredoxin